MTESHSTVSEERRRKIIDTIQRIERQLVHSLPSKGDLDLERIFDATSDFESRILALLISEKEIKPAVTTFEDRYYFPKVTHVIDYVKQRYGVALPRSRRETVVKRAAQIVLQNNGLETLKGDLKKIREQVSRKPKIPKVNVHMMEIEEIRREFSDTCKYPTVAHIKAAVKGSGLSKNISKKTKRESVIEAIIDAVSRARSIRVFSKKGE